MFYYIRYCTTSTTAAGISYAILYSVLLLFAVDVKTVLFLS